jgi:hypothetical protein
MTVRPKGQSAKKFSVVVWGEVAERLYVCWRQTTEPLRK